MANTVMTSGQAARRVGLSATALRDYEVRGILKPQRTAGGWRLYSEAQLKRLEAFLRKRLTKRAIAAHDSKPKHGNVLTDNG
jgi:DNA-binding transcriptional MerR regulator